MIWCFMLIIIIILEIYVCLPVDKSGRINEGKIKLIIPFSWTLKRRVWFSNSNVLFNEGNIFIKLSSQWSNIL